MNKKQSLVKNRVNKSLSFLNATNFQVSKISKSETELLLSRISKSSSLIFRSVIQLVETRGYLSLGFNTVQNCLRVKVPEISNSYICRLLQSAETYLMLDPMMQKIDLVSEGAFREFKGLTEQQSKAVWAEALKLFAPNRDRSITAKHIKRAMTKLGIKTVNIEKHLPIDVRLQNKVKKYAVGSRDFIFAQSKTKQEYLALAKIFYDQLVAFGSTASFDPDED